MKYDVIIIGSGLGGLECGALLSRSGLGVLVLEQNAQSGGCLQSYKRGSIEFDTGFHYVGGLAEGQSLHGAFRALGLLSLPWQRLDSDGFDRVRIGKDDYLYAEGYDNFVQRMTDYFPTEHRALVKYADLLRKTADAQMSVLTNDEAGVALTERLSGTNAWQYLHYCVSIPALLDVLSGTSIKMELRKQSLPLLSFLHGNGSFIEGSWRLRGSGSLITDALTAEIERNGGSVVCGKRVSSITEKSGMLDSAVCADGTEYSGRLFISDIHPAKTCQMVEGNSRIRPAYRRRMCGLANTFGMFTVSLCYEQEQVPYFNYNQYVYSQPDVWVLSENNRPVKGVLISCKVPTDGSQYTRQVDLLTPMQWDECSAFAGTKPLHRGAEYEELKTKKAAECIELATSCMPELSSPSRVYTSTPLTWNSYTDTPEGSAYGVRKDCGNPLVTLLSPKTPIPNLLMTGQSLMLHGVHGVTMTALHTCAEVIGGQKVRSMIEK